MDQLLSGLLGGGSGGGKPTSSAQADVGASNVSHTGSAIDSTTLITLGAIAAGTLLLALLFFKH
jgi:hypothetical protein